MCSRSSSEQKILSFEPDHQPRLATIDQWRTWAAWEIKLLIYWNTSWKILTHLRDPPICIFVKRIDKNKSAELDKILQKSGWNESQERRLDENWVYDSHFLQFFNWNKKLSFKIFVKYWLWKPVYEKQVKGLVFGSKSKQATQQGFLPDQF